MQIDTVFSSDDGGYYAEVWGTAGQDLFTTQIFSSRGAARRNAEEWVARNCPGVVKRGRDI